MGTNQTSANAVPGDTLTTEDIIEAIRKAPLPPIKHLFNKAAVDEHGNPAAYMVRLKDAPEFMLAHPVFDPAYEVQDDAPDLWKQISFRVRERTLSSPLRTL